MKKLSTKTHQSETHKVVCRVNNCKIQILGKNYWQHLTEIHPNEDSSDLSPHGQRKIFIYETAKQMLKRRTEEVSPDVATAKKQAKDTLHIMPEDNDMSPCVQVASSTIFESKNTCTSTSTPLNPFSESLNKITSDVSVIKQNIKNNPRV